MYSEISTFASSIFVLNIDSYFEFFKTLAAALQNIKFEVFLLIKRNIVFDFYISLFSNNEPDFIRLQLEQY